MRLFIAIDLDELFPYFKSIQKGIRGVDAKFTDSFHITLKFLGEISPDKVKNIKDALKNVRFQKFRINVGGIGAFPNPGYIKVVWIGATSDDKRLRSLHHQIDNCMYNIGFKKDEDFVPHITLARIKNVKNKRIFSDSISSIHTENKEIICNKFYLIKSTLTKVGPVYEKVEVFNAE